MRWWRVWQHEVCCEGRASCGGVNVMGGCGERGGAEGRRLLVAERDGTAMRTNCWHLYYPEKTKNTKVPLCPQFFPEKKKKNSKGRHSQSRLLPDTFRTPPPPPPRPIHSFPCPPSSPPHKLTQPQQPSINASHKPIPRAPPPRTRRLKPHQSQIR